MASKLSDAQKSDLKALFDKYDADKNGEITAKELGEFFHKCGISMSKLQIANIMGKADTDGSGTINFEEFCNAEVPTFDEAQFKKYDVNGDGFLGPEEVTQLAKDLGHKDVTPKTVKAIMDDFDKNKDGKISLEEFKILNGK